MNFSIPGLEGYFGGKGSSGVPQQIINIIPPHETLIIPFLGHCAITRSIKPAKNFIAFEKDKEVFKKWARYLSGKNPAQDIFSALQAHSFDSGIGYDTYFLIRKMCGIEFLEALVKPRMSEFIPFGGIENPVIYCDPPYLQSTYESASKYDHEMTEADHERFLNAVTKIDAPVLVSHYKNELYDSHLKRWNTISFMSQTRSGKPRRETVYFNYEKPTELHDYSYFGNCYRSREAHKRAASNMVAKFNRMKPLEKNFILHELQKSGVISQL